MGSIAQFLAEGTALGFLEAGVRSPYTGFWFIGLEKYKNKNFGRADVFWRRFDLFGGMQEYMYNNGVWRFDANTDTVHIEVLKEEYFYDNKGMDDDISELHEGTKSFTLRKVPETEISSIYGDIDTDSMNPEEEEQLKEDKNLLHVQFARSDPESGDKSIMASPPSSLYLVTGGVRNMPGENAGNFTTADELKQFYRENGFAN